MRNYTRDSKQTLKKNQGPEHAANPGSHAANPGSHAANPGSHGKKPLK